LYIFVSLLQRNLARDILMALAITHVHNLPPTVPCITQKPKYDTDELKQRLTDTLDYIPQGIIDKATDQWQTRLRAYVKAKGVTLNTCCDLATQRALFRATLDPPKPVLFRATHLIERYNINFRFSVMSGSVET